MVGENFDLVGGTRQQWSPMFEGFDYHLEFEVVNVVIAFGFIECGRVVAYRVSFTIVFLLQQYCSCSEARRVYFQFKLLIQFWMCEDRFACDTGLESVEGLLAFQHPVPIMILLGECIEWFGDIGKTSVESPIKIAKTQKGTNVLDLDRRWPVFDTCNFDWIHASHPLFKDYPQVINSGGVEDALLRFEIEVVVGSKL